MKVNAKSTLSPAWLVLVIQTEQAYRLRLWRKQKKQALQDLEYLEKLLQWADVAYTTDLEAEASAIVAHTRKEHEQLCAFFASANRKIKRLQKIKYAGI